MTSICFESYTKTRIPKEAILVPIGTRAKQHSDNDGIFKLAFSENGSMNCTYCSHMLVIILRLGAVYVHPHPTVERDERDVSQTCLLTNLE